MCGQSSQAPSRQPLLEGKLLAAVLGGADDVMAYAWSESRSYNRSVRSSRSSAVISRRAAVASAERSPCLTAFIFDRDLPCSVLGPVLHRHGCVC